MDASLPFYLWTGAGPYLQVQPDFDQAEAHHEDEEHGYARVGHRRLHQLRRHGREDPGLIVQGRALIPARHAPALRQRLFTPVALLPDLPR